LRDGDDYDDNDKDKDDYDDDDSMVAPFLGKETCRSVRYSLFEVYFRCVL